MIERLKKLAREPLLHFLLIGAGIYASYGYFGADDGEGDERTITVSAGDVQALTDQWMKLWYRPPTEEEFEGLLRDHVRTKILYKEAVAMGLDQGDLVIERRLAQRVELLAKGLITPEDPTDEELRAWFDANLEEYKQPDLYTVRHVFFDPDRREATTLDDAAAALEVLLALDSVPADFGSYGDRFMLQNYYPDRTALDLQKLFGKGFVDEVVNLEPNQWHGPVLSGYGTHLVMISDVVRPQPPAFEDVRELVREEVLAERIEELSERFVQSLTSRYEIIIEEVEVPLTPAAANK